MYWTSPPMVGAAWCPSDYLYWEGTVCTVQCAGGREGHVRPLHHCNNSDAVQFVPYDSQTYKKQKEDNDENAELALVL